MRIIIREGMGMGMGRKGDWFPVRTASSNGIKGFIRQTKKIIKLILNIIF
jgi:hypothetical protein